MVRFAECACALSVRGPSPQEKEQTLKPRRGDSGDDLRPEYDLKEMLKGGVRGKYAKRDAAGSNAVLLEPDVRRVFPDGKAVNDALRLVIALRKVGTARPAAPGR